jgi:hypothetical protein
MHGRKETAQDIDIFSTAQVETPQETSSSSHNSTDPSTVTPDY